MTVNPNGSERTKASEDKGNRLTKNIFRIVIFDEVKVNLTTILVSGTDVDFNMCISHVREMCKNIVREMDPV